MTFEEFKEKLEGICLIEVSGESCANCLTLLPLVNKLVVERDDCKFFHIEAGFDTKELVTGFGIVEVPTLLVCLDGKEVARCKGFVPEEILSLWIDAKIENCKKLMGEKK